MNYCAYMKNIYVHLGYPKTGSTFIQKEIFSQFKSFKIYNISFNKKLKIFDIFFLLENQSILYLLIIQNIIEILSKLIIT